jgi:hypothetical protein
MTARGVHLVLTMPEQDHVTRIVERLRRDHPDAAMREQLYAEGKLPAYVAILMNDVDDPALVERVTAAVRAAEDGTPGEHQ